MDIYILLKTKLCFNFGNLLTLLDIYVAVSKTFGQDGKDLVSEKGTENAQ